MDNLQEIIEKINQFSTDRDWNQFHTPANLAKSISIEANELLECFQWNDFNYRVENVAEELADVFNYCIRLASVIDLDIKTIILDKLEKNAIKYPVQKARGISKKYTEL